MIGTRKFSRFIAWALIAFEGLSLALLVGILYGLLNKTMTQEFLQKSHVRGSEASVALQDRLNSLEMRLRDISSNNTLRVSLMLGVDSQLKETMETLYPPSNGASFLIHREPTGCFVPGLPETFTALNPHLHRIALDDHMRKARFVSLGGAPFYSIFSNPVRRREERLGTAFVVYDISQDTRFWQRLGSTSSGKLYMRDKGHLVDLRTGHRLLLPEEFLDPRGDELFPIQQEAFVPLKDFPGLVYGTSSQPLEEKRESLVYMLGLLCAAIFLMTLFVALIIARKVGSPLGSMADQAAEIAREPSSTGLREEELQYVEFRKLAQAFNHVLMSLREAQEELREQAKKELDASERKYSTLVQTSPNGIFSVNRQGEILFANRALEEITGYSRSDLRSTLLWDMLQPDERDRMGQLLENHVKRGAQMILESRWTRKDGGPIWVELRATQIEDKEAQALLLNVTDVTERKIAEEALRQSEENYRLVVDNANDAIFVIQDEVIKFANPRVEELTGYASKELARTSFVPLIHPEDRGMVLETHKKRLRGEDVPSTYSFRVINKKAEELLIEINPVLITWEGRPATLNFVRDITEHKQLEAQLRQAQKMEAIGTLAGGIAHDFNNILSIILGNSELAMEDAQAQGLPLDGLKDVLDGCLRAKDLVGQILSFSRQTEQELKPTMISPIFKESLKLLRSSIPTTIDIRHHISCASDTVLADPTQMNQVLMNLCTNAAHAMAQRGGTLEVKLENVVLREDEAMPYQGLLPGVYVRLTVSDTGHGIESQLIDRIFEPYFTTKEVGEGTGLGLAVVHGIVKSHGGVITADSVPGKGTTFTVLLPSASGEMKNESEACGPPPKGKERILFVDDESALAKLGEQMLGRLGYDVVSTTSSVEALELFRSTPGRFDLIITDTTMPRMTGEKLAAEVIKIRPDFPVILCTGYSDRISEKAATDVGIRAFVMKPVSKSTMAETVREVLDDVFPRREPKAAA
ncbi:MAG: PAS domain S-box protein [Thermodesulfobacteriota bacterium]|nr:PAS domain S-box protein [Thermodesulfobacteriota bacterium]